MIQLFQCYHTLIPDSSECMLPHSSISSMLICDCRKYGSDGKELEKWSGKDADGKRKEKQEASDLFKSYWRRCTADEEYLALKDEWQKQKKEYKKS